MYTDLNGTCFEGVGLPLSDGEANAVPLDPSLKPGGSDLAIERAIELLNDPSNSYQYSTGTERLSAGALALPTCGERSPCPLRTPAISW